MYSFSSVFFLCQRRVYINFDFSFAFSSVRGVFCIVTLRNGKKPQLSFSCFLALLLPLSDLHGEIPDLIESNTLTNQLQTGQIDMPTVLGGVNDSGIFTVTQEEGDKMTIMMMLMMSMTRKMEMMLLTQRKYKISTVATWSITVQNVIKGL